MFLLYSSCLLQPSLFENDLLNFDTVEKQSWATSLKGRTWREIRGTLSLIDVMDWLLQPVLCNGIFGTLSCPSQLPYCEHLNSGTEGENGHCFFGCRRSRGGEGEVIDIRSFGAIKLGGNYMWSWYMLLFDMGLFIFTGRLFYCSLVAA